jgi:heme a synthase
MSSYDKKINDFFYYWLISIFLLVFIMVIVGGLTRLTNSGLSITQWELFSGILPPMNSMDWDKYFSLYKEIPQYKLINSSISLNEFKIIFYWEYFHRILGRLIGLSFLIPLAYFYLSNKINKKYLLSCLFILILIILQGIVGWYMVKSGLVNSISVSHYRLSLHLIVAFFIISMLFWLILNVKRKKNNDFFSNKKYCYYFYFLFFLIFTQIIIGAFVSGLDAGKIYQTWPLMGYSYFPDDISVKTIKNLFLFDNHSLVQFYHRNIAYLLSLYILIIGYIIYKNKFTKLNNHFFLVIILLFFQIVLGITTLLSGLNIYLASLHQICGLFLTLSAINLYYNYIN